MKQASHDRGIAFGIIVFFAILTITALLYILMNPVVTELNSQSDDRITDGTNAQTHVDLLDTIWGVILVYMLFLAGVYIITRSVFESRGPG